MRVADVSGSKISQSKPSRLQVSAFCRNKLRSRSCKLWQMCSLGQEERRREETTETFSSIARAGKPTKGSLKTAGSRLQGTMRRRSTRIEMNEVKWTFQEPCGVTHRFERICVDRNVSQSTPPVFLAVLSVSVEERTRSQKLHE